MAHEAAGIPVRARAASNPGNIGHGWVKERFIKRPEPGVVFIPAKLSDNPGLERATYEHDLRGLPDELRRMLLEGDWGAFEGAAFTISRDHLIDEFPLQDAHDRFEALDYGLNGAPWALCAVDFEGNVVFHDMIYEHDMLPTDVAQKVLGKRNEGWGHGHAAWGDPTLWKRTWTKNKLGRPAVLADEFAEGGAPIVAANNDPRAGLIRVKQMLALDPQHRFPNWHERAGEPDAPRVFFVKSRCVRLIEELRSAPLQPNDKPDGGEKINPEWESHYGHAVAMVRYALMTRPAASVQPYEPPEDPRARFIDEFYAQRDNWNADRFEPV